MATLEAAKRMASKWRKEAYAYGDIVSPGIPRGLSYLPTGPWLTMSLADVNSLGSGGPDSLLLTHW